MQLISFLVSSKYSCQNTDLRIKKEKQSQSINLPTLENDFDVPLPTEVFYLKNKTKHANIYV